ncbi:hypothetical protein ABZ490_45195 [Streptomyces sp. NPDC005811]|uniref:hypothetical protein n=1 Tax=Streptomyces sp. NPDC005811 TaxID=3154565 RepID=UPI0033EB1CB8
MGELLDIMGAVVGAGGLALTYLGLRHQWKQARELGVRQVALQTRERETERQDATLHASMLRVAVGKQPSRLGLSVALWWLTVTNDSTQPFTGVALRYGDQALAPAELNGLLGPGACVTKALPVNGEEPDPARCFVEFTDVAGRPWRRFASGDLHRGHLGPLDGEVRWEAGEAHHVRAALVGGSEVSAGSGAIAATGGSLSGGLNARTVVAVVCGMAVTVVMVVAWFVTVR